jgi:hypothetical protein
VCETVTGHISSSIERTTTPSLETKRLGEYFRSLVAALRYDVSTRRYDAVKFRYWQNFDMRKAVHADGTGYVRTHEIKANGIIFNSIQAIFIHATCMARYRPSKFRVSACLFYGTYGRVFYTYLYI